MKYGVVDVGSNSVRLMISVDGITQKKYVKITRLAEGMKDCLVQAESIERTKSAVYFFFEQAKTELVDKIFIFATAAVRRAKNASDFISAVKDLTGITVDVVSGEKEAEMGFLGALNGKDGGIIDIGGASTEIVAVKNGKNLFKKSLDIGVVKIKDNCGQDRAKIQEYIDKTIIDYGAIPRADYYGIGGTATSLAAIAQELDPYDPQKVDGYTLNKEKLKSIIDKLFLLSVEERKKIKGLQPERAEVIAGGACLIYSIMEYAKIDKIVVSEKDNLEGYLSLKMER